MNFNKITLLALPFAVSACFGTSNTTGDGPDVGTSEDTWTIVYGANYNSDAPVMDTLIYLHEDESTYKNGYQVPAWRSASDESKLYFLADLVQWERSDEGVPYGSVIIDESSNEKIGVFNFSVKPGISDHLKRVTKNDTRFSNFAALNYSQSFVKERYVRLSNTDSYSLEDGIFAGGKIVRLAFPNPGPGSAFARSVGLTDYGISMFKRSTFTSTRAGDFASLRICYLVSGVSSVLTKTDETTKTKTLFRDRMSEEYCTPNMEALSDLNKFNLITF